MSFRSILPASPFTDVPEKPGFDDTDSRPRKRSNLTLQACLVCRRLKIKVSDPKVSIKRRKLNTTKCDGARPKCAHCVSKDKECGYSWEEGQTRQAAMSSRLKLLEDLFLALKFEPLSKVNRLLDQLRLTNDLQSAMESFMEEEDKISKTPKVKKSTTSANTFQTSLLPPPTIHTPTSQQNSMDGISGSESSFQSHPSLEEVWGFADINLPGEAVTKKAISGFLDFGSKLFHVFTPVQLAIFHQDIFHGELGKSKLAICCLSSASAVGTQYIDATPEDSHAFYTIAKRHLDDVIASHPLDAMKVCSLLAMYNIMDKGAVALIYVGKFKNSFSYSSIKNSNY
jgi:hypothetical protein